MPLTKDNVTNVLLQATYMSGDRNTIASALQADAKLGVVILADGEAPATADELKNFYVGVAGAARIVVAPIPRGTAPDAKTALQGAYKAATRDLRAKYSRWPVWLTNAVGNGVQLQSATFGTKVIAKAFHENPGEAQRVISRLWALDRVEQEGLAPSYSDLMPRVEGWLEAKGFRKDRKYVVLFAKSGDRAAEKAHHFTSILTWRVLQDRIAVDTSIIPVAAGDNIGLKTLPSLVTFWDDPEWNRIFDGHRIDPRAAQMGLWCYLADQYKGLSIVGMRSGILEVPALLGIRTLYLEEQHNAQATRMAQWLGKVPGYHRQVVTRPAGIVQQKYWAEASAKARPGSDVAVHATTHGGHLGGIVNGFAKENLNKRRADTVLAKDSVEEPHARQIASAVFGRGGLAPELPASKFMLETSEFDSIITWIKNGSAAPVVAQGSVQGSLVRRDDVGHDLASEREITDWSKYFASPEYQSKFKGMSFPTALSDA